ncbi:MAG: 2-oxo acid dehydrogenase subunit E2 [Oscillospiraceae bacterium]|jgi:hypothetical protein|nr:2-oxo acid dehydrogenase subunit E2 [Oscillospiraceae bacterium]
MPGTPYRRRLGDRKEGRLLRSYPAYNKMTPFLMKKRSDASNYFQDELEVTQVDRWLRQKRAEGYKGLGTLHLFIAAYIRTIACRPALNRFVSGQRVFARHDVDILMTVKHSLSDASDESSIKVRFKQTDTIFDVYRKMNAEIDSVKAQNGDNGADNFANNVMKLPRLIINFVVWALKVMDYFGLIPQSILDFSPFHGSMIITDIGSIGAPPIFHHIYDFGNLPIFLALGIKQRRLEMDDEGKIVERKYVRFTATTDERICDGFYLATSLKYLKHYLNNPQLLETPPEKVEQDIF